MDRFVNVLYIVSSFYNNFIFATIVLFRSYMLILVCVVSVINSCETIFTKQRNTFDIRSIYISWIAGHF